MFWRVVKVLYKKIVFDLTEKYFLYLITINIPKGYIGNFKDMIILHDKNYASYFTALSHPSTSTTLDTYFLHRLYIQYITENVLEPTIISFS